MTGYHVRMKRDGEWQNLDVAELTDAELEDWERVQSGDGWPWAIALAKWIRDNVKTEPR
jgi:hypothetical protein